MAGKLLLGALLALSLDHVQGGIYPDGHWSHSTKLTTDNFEDTIQAEIDQGKTMFVRWIASEG
jgi:hypothetical protein